MTLHFVFEIAFECLLKLSMRFGDVFGASPSRLEIRIQIFMILKIWTERCGSDEGVENPPPPTHPTPTPHTQPTHGPLVKLSSTQLDSSEIRQNSACTNETP
jgi:hypothetical protein